MSETLELNVCGHQWTVTGRYIKASRGAREEGQQMEPDEPAGFEIKTITLPGYTEDLQEVLDVFVTSAIQTKADEESREAKEDPDGDYDACRDLQMDDQFPNENRSAL